MIAPENQFGFWKRTFTVLAGSGTAMIASWPAKSVSEKLQDSPLTDSNVLMLEYGMPADKAEDFVAIYRKKLTNNAHFDGLLSTGLQELFATPKTDTNLQPK